MHNSAFLISNQKASTGWESWKFIHEIVEKDFFKRIATQFSQSIYLSNKILVFKFCSCIQLDSVVESFWDWEQVDELHKTSQRMHEVSDNRSPSHLWRIIKWNFVNERDMRFYRIKVRDHSRVTQNCEDSEECNFNH